MNRKMFWRVIILYCCLLYSSADVTAFPKCLTGYMTDIQSWVDEYGGLQPNPYEVDNAIDLSTSPDPVPALHQKISLFRAPHRIVKYLSFARCKLSRVPPIFQLRDHQSRHLSSTLEYMTLYGNSFEGMTSAGEQYTMTFNASGTVEMNLSSPQTHAASVWSSGFTSVNFPHLRELDLRSCSIQVLGHNLFKGMPNLTALYIGENEISYIDSTAFYGLKSLIHLDFSRNHAYDENGNPRNLVSDSYYTFKDLENLISLDLSFTKLTQRNLGMIRSLGKSLKSLSLCETGLNSLQDGIFNTTSLQILDLSRNSGILSSHGSLEGLEETLVILYAREIGLNTLEILRNFSKVEILQLSHNEINNVRESVTRTFSSLKVLDLNKNRVTSWFDPTYGLMKELRFLSLKDNNINVITEEMIADIMHIDYLALSGNYMICNCHAKDLYKMAAKNEKIFNDTMLKMPLNQLNHNGYPFYNRIIKERLNVQLDTCDDACFEDIGYTGTFRLVDYSPSSYICLMVPESRSVLISNVTSCSKASREMNYEQELAVGKKKLLALLAIPCTLLPAVLLFLFRRHIRYFFITIRNSAMLSMINKKDFINDNTIFNYDVFVSYCNEDRGWVLDHLLPHMEAECSISACLHERDFQVGLSILENIVHSMDRSRSIMLIISQRFLLSQWCQFEMHLAQHRLLETRREDLTLVLLEDIPRRLRPNTLHYLMLTKTYIVWPKDESERCIFWKRLKKTLISQKSKPTENVSLA